MAMRVLVCGGRDFDDWSVVSAKLNALHRKHGVTVLIHGAARGADRLAAHWAALRGVEVIPFRAEWRRYGDAAGPIRNQRMLDEGVPDCVVAFPSATKDKGHGGTLDMITRARAAGITKIWEIKR